MSSDQNNSADDDRVMSFDAWCHLNGFSIGTGLRLRKAGQGPRFVQLSPRRIGVRVGDNRAWQESRSTT